MIKKRFPVYYQGKMMPWGSGTAVWGAGGFVFLAGTEGQIKAESVIEEGMAAQTRLTLEKIKQRLEEFGTTLDNLCHLWVYIVGDFPDGAVADAKYQELRKARDAFWAENCPDFLSNPPPSTLVPVPALGAKGQLVEITAIAALPPLT